MDGSRPDDERVAHGADAVREGAYVRAGWVLAIAIILADQVTKWWILEIVMQPPQVIEVFPFFNLVLTWNTGVSFGLFAGASGWQPFFLSALAVGVCIALAIWLKRADGKWLAWGLGLIIGGALGNVIDRLRIGAVTDFLDVHVAGYHWPAFNVADAAITTGAAILILDSLFRKDKSS